MEALNGMPVEKTDAEKNREAFQEWLQAHPEYLDAVESRVQEEVMQEKAALQIEQEKKLAEVRAEAERVARMTTEEKLQHLQQEKEKELEAREKELTQRENRAQALEMLHSRGLPAALLDALCFESMEKCLESLNKVEAAFRGAVQAGVTARMTGAAPALENHPAEWNAVSDEEYYRNLYAHDYAHEKKE